MRRIFAVILVLVLMLTGLAIPKVTYACSCVPPAPPEQVLARADAVFAGTILDVDTFALPLLDRSTVPVRVTIEVNKVWKGGVSERVVIRTARDEAACGYNFNVGDDYLVYAHPSEYGLVTGLCERTTELGTASEDLAVLGSGEPPLMIEEGAPIWLRLFLGGLLFLLLTGAILAFAILRGRPATSVEGEE